MLCLVIPHRYLINLDLLWLIVILLCGVLGDQGKPHEAEEQYRAGLVTDPNLAEAAAGLGTALRDMGRTDEAVRLQPEAADHNQSCKYIQRLKSYRRINFELSGSISYQTRCVRCIL